MKEVLIGFILGLAVLMAFPSVARSTHNDTIFDRLERM